jgi:uncharacterized integral membrane protein
MFFIWKGWGVLALIIPIFFIFIVQFVTNFIFGQDFYQHSDWTLSLVLILSAVSAYFIGIKLNSKPPRVLIDKESGDEIEFKQTHSMFWIPLEYWGFIMFGLGVFVFFKKMM